MRTFKFAKHSVNTPNILRKNPLSPFYRRREVVFPLPRSHPVLQLPFVPFQVPETDQQRHQSGEWRGVSHQYQVGGVNLTAQVGEGDTEQEGGNHAVYHGEPRVTLPAEVRVDAEHEAHHHAVDAVSAQVSGCHCYHGGVVRENACQRFGQEL